MGAKQSWQMHVALVLLLVACGRLHFEPLSATPVSGDASQRHDGALQQDGASGVGEDAGVNDAGLEADGGGTSSLPLSCADGEQNNDETGLDCGGSCRACALPVTECDGVTSVPVHECNALVAFYNAAGGAGWNDSTGWLVDPDPCMWQWVTCESNHVASLQVFDQRLSGTIASELAELSELVTLIIASDMIIRDWRTSLGGTIPPALGQLSKLRHLEINAHFVAGGIPSELSNLSALTYLDLSDNRLTGALPEHLARLVNLRVLDLNRNQFTGPIPSAYGDLTELTFLSLFSNQVTGPLPPSLGSLTSCTSLSLANNDLSGAVPVEIMNVPATTLFSIGGQSGCLTASDPALVTWLNDKDSGWDDGCRGNGNP